MALCKLRRTSTTDKVKVRYELTESGRLLESRGIDKHLWKLFMPGQVEVTVEAYKPPGQKWHSIRRINGKT